MARSSRWRRRIEFWTYEKRALRQKTGCLKKSLEEIDRCLAPKEKHRK